MKFGKAKSLSVNDFPRKNYSVYWEYFVNNDESPVEWECRFIEYATGAIVETKKGSSASAEQARLDAQACVPEVMSKFERKD